MLDEATRTAILKLHDQGHGSRMISRTLATARSTVRRAISSGHAQVPPLVRAQLAEAWREAILELYARYEGHLGRVHEELLQRGATLSYPALTAFCRKHGIGTAPPLPAGRYEFPAGAEMQHDTSPHQAKIRGVLTRVQTASVMLCYSRMIFFQMYPRFTRFECKAFLAQAIAYFHGAAATCMIDNSHVVVAAGSGATMIPAPEMAAFAERYGFVFTAHEKGDANRSARVEAPFHRIEQGFSLVAGLLCESGYFALYQALQDGVSAQLRGGRVVDQVQGKAENDQRSRVSGIAFQPTFEIRWAQLRGRRLSGRSAICRIPS